MTKKQRAKLTIYLDFSGHYQADIRDMQDELNKVTKEISKELGIPEEILLTVAANLHAEPTLTIDMILAA